MLSHRDPSSSADVLPLAKITQLAPERGAMELAECARTLFGAGSVLATLQRIVDLSVGTVRGCDGASVSLVQGDAVITPVWTEDAVVEVDTLQYSTGEGPCLDAIANETTFYSTDLAIDPRWPAFGPQAARRGFRSLLSLRLGADRTFGGLNLYGHDRASYDEPDRSHALAFSIHAGVALAAADDLEAARRSWAHDSKRLSHVEGALSSSQTIALARGVLMGSQGVDAYEAFTLLRRASLRGNLRLLDVARSVVETGRIVPGLVGAGR